MNDKHNLKRISTVLGILLSAFFAAIAVAGYQRTGDVMQLLLFLLLAGAAFAVVKLLFYGIGRLLDKLDPS
jgi:ABC-type arginine transport system permease subunit